MKTKIISPEDLRPLTTVPQCTDNQFVPKEFFSRIAGKTPLKTVLEDMLLPESSGHSSFAEYRQKTQTEYKRSLIYSNQVVLNRAAFWNTPPLISSALGADRSGLATLIAQHTIVPFLYNETAFDQDPNFDILPQGHDALEALIGDPILSEVACVRLGGTHAHDHKKSVDALTIDFRSQLAHLLDADDVRERSLEVAGVLLGGDGAAKADPPKAQALAEKIEHLAKWVRERKPSRNAIYQEFLTDGPPSDGLYRTDPLTFEVKLWVDLVYNSNLPRHLGVLTFVPTGFPTPLDVGLTWAVAERHKAKVQEGGEGALQDILDHARSHATWKAWDTIQKHANLSIPSPDELTHLDIVAIRGWDEWKAMMTGMERYVDAPLEEEKAKEFLRLYTAFLARLSKWWLETKKATREKWASGVAKVYRYGKWFVGLLACGGNHVIPILPPAGVHLPHLPPEESVRVVVETGLYLFQHGQTDWRRTQLVRSMARQTSLSHQHLVATWEAIRQLYTELPPTYPGHDLSGPLATEED